MTTATRLQRVDDAIKCRRAARDAACTACHQAEYDMQEAEIDRLLDLRLRVMRAATP